MSWIEKRLQPFTITTGDGIVFTPLWDSTRSVVLIQEFNIAAFNFNKVPGTLIDRGEVMGNVYDIEVVFQGPDHLILAKDFRDSAKDKRVWTINHPYYGIFPCHPAGLKYNNEEGNITRITGTVLETIRSGKAGNGVSAFDKVTIDKLDTDTALFSTYHEAVPTPQVVDIQGMQANIGEIDDSVSPLVKISDDFNTFKNAVNTADYYVLKATEFPAQAIASVQAVVSAPAYFIDTVVNRIDMLVGAYVGLYNFAVDLPRNTRKLYENNAGTAITSICLAAVSNITNDYTNRPAVIDVITTILDTYNGYITNLDTLSSDNGGLADSYIPDPVSINKLADIVNFTVGQLLVIAASSKQRNIYILPENQNLYNVCYTLYGTSADDVVTQFINDNSLNFRNFLMLRKGREIIYYT